MSHPADTVVSKLNNSSGSTAVQAARELGMKGKIYNYIYLYSITEIPVTVINCFYVPLGFLSLLLESLLLSELFKFPPLNEHTFFFYFIA